MSLCYFAVCPTLPHYVNCICAQIFSHRTVWSIFTIIVSHTHTHTHRVMLTHLLAYEVPFSVGRTRAETPLRAGSRPIHEDIHSTSSAYHCYANRRGIFSMKFMQVH